MPERKESPEPQDSQPRRLARRRNRLAPDSAGGKLSRPLAAAFILILAGGAYLFWPRGGGVPVGLGERLSVVTADTVINREPRSGSVDIDQEVKPLVAEKAAPGEQPEEQPRSEPRAQPQEQPPAPPPSQPSAQPRPQPRQQATTPPATPAPTPAPITPGPTGGWAVQVGAYGTEQNADKVASDLRADGIEAHVRAASTSTGEMVYRVWIGWFASRDQALAYARQERARLGDAHPVHR